MERGLTFARFKEVQVNKDNPHGCLTDKSAGKGQMPMTKMGTAFVVRQVFLRMQAAIALKNKLDPEWN